MCMLGDWHEGRSDVNSHGSTLKVLERIGSEGRVMTYGPSAPQSPQDGCDYGMGVGVGVGAGLLFSTHICLETCAHSLPWGTLTQQRIFARLFSRLTASFHSTHPLDGLCQWTKFGQKKVGLHTGHPVWQIRLAILPLRYFLFLPISSPSSFSFFFFLKTHHDTSQRSLIPSHNLGDSCPPHLFFGHNSQSQNLSIGNSARLKTCSRSCFIGTWRHRSGDRPFPQNNVDNTYYNYA